MVWMFIALRVPHVRRRAKSGQVPALVSITVPRGTSCTAWGKSGQAPSSCPYHPPTRCVSRSVGEPFWAGPSIVYSLLFAWCDWHIQFTSLALSLVIAVIMLGRYGRALYCTSSLCPIVVAHAATCCGTRRNRFSHSTHIFQFPL